LGLGGESGLGDITGLDSFLGRLAYVPGFLVPFSTFLFFSGIFDEMQEENEGIGMDIP
jgi:hypothetical protein